MPVNDDLAEVAVAVQEVSADPHQVAVALPGLAELRA